MESGSIELKIRSCKDLKAFNFFLKLSVCALVSIVSDDPDKKTEQKLQKQEQKTPIDREGDGNPEWNHEMRFDLDEALFRDCDNIFIHFDLRNEVLVFGQQTIGEVRVPLKDLVGESAGVVRFVSYQVKSTDGKPNGVLNFSYKINGNPSIPGIYPPASQIAGFPIVHHHHHYHESPEINYPSLDVENSSPEKHYPCRENIYPPLDLGSPPPVPMALQPPPHLQWPQPPPPPPPVIHGPCYHLHPPPPPPPPPPQGYPWAPYNYVGPYDYERHGIQSPIGGQMHGLGPLGNGETWPNGFPDRHFSHWNGG